MSLLAAASNLDIGAVLIDILVVLAAAKAAAEVAERLGIPTVLGEIVAGILVGPSVLGLVGKGDALAVLAEIGVLLLLLLVGMEMDVGQLARVGRSAVLVAIAGVVLPFAGGFLAARALGLDSTTSIFLGAALTATSVGITARVFGDLRALATPEARIVLGAAVVDDVLGLVILTVVVKLSSGASISVWSVGGTLALAVAFLLVTGVVGRKLLPPLLSGVERRARGTGTLVAVAMAVALGFAALAGAAHLAPIIGAFMAGLALSGSPVAHRVERDLAPLGHVFMPVFFLYIGVEADVRAMFSGRAIEIAAVLSVIAVVGKVAAGRLAGRGPDRLLVGLGMIPRGEVGLIFAGLGVRAGVLDADLYGALITVVLVTTVITPPLLRLRAASAADPAVDAPDDHLEIALRLAVVAAQSTDPPAGVDDLLEHRGAPLHWTPAAAHALVDVIRDGDARSWRLLHATDVLRRAFPAADATLDRRRRDVTSLDPNSSWEWPVLSRLREAIHDDPVAAGRFATLADPDAVYVAAWLADLADEPTQRQAVAAEFAAVVPLPPATSDEVVFLIAHLPTMVAASHHIEALDEAHVLDLAEHIGSVDRLRALTLLATSEYPAGFRAGGEEVYQRLLDALAHPELSGPDASGLAATRLAEAMRLAPTDEVRERLAHAPRSMLVREQPAELAAQARLVEPRPRPGVVRVAITPDEAPRRWRIDVATLDAPGLLARLAAVLTAAEMTILSASVSTWPDGAVLDSFIVADSEAATRRPSARDLGEQFEASLRGRLPTSIPVDVDVSFSDDLMPWCTSVRVTGADRPGLLAAIAADFARLHLRVQTASVATADGRVDDVFAVVDRRGRKLDAATRQRLAALITRGAPVRARHILPAR